MSGTMKIRGNGCVISGEEGRTPPLPHITVSASEGRALIAQNLAVEVDGDADANAEAEAAEVAAREAAEREAAETAAREAAELAECEAAEAAEREAAANAEAEANANANADTNADTNTGENTGENTGGDEANAERIATIVEALDLVEPAGLVKSGKRKGKPSVAAIEEITGLTEVNDAEIDAAMAAKDAAE